MRHLDAIYEIEVISLYFLRELHFFKTLVFHCLLDHGIALTISIVIVKHTDLFATELIVIKSLLLKFQIIIIKETVNLPYYTVDYV